MIGASADERIELSAPSLIVGRQQASRARRDPSLSDASIVFAPATTWSQLTLILLFAGDRCSRLSRQRPAIPDADSMMSSSVAAS